MKPKTKVFIAVLVCCVLLLAFTVCAGCTENNDVITCIENSDVTPVSETTSPSYQEIDLSNDPIIGSFMTTADYSSACHVVRDYYPNGTYYETFVYYDGGPNDVDGPYKWEKTGDNQYGNYVLSDDGNTLFKTYTLLGKNKTITFKRIDNPETYKIPIEIPTIPGSSLGKSDPIIGTWKTTSGVYCEFKADGTYTYTFTLFPDKEYTFNWVKFANKDNQYMDDCWGEQFTLSSDGKQLTCTSCEPNMVFSRIA